MKVFPPLYCLLFGVAVVSAACNERPSLPDVSHQEKIPAEAAMNFDGLIAALRIAGVNAMPAAEVEQPFFSVPGRMLGISGEDVQVFQYANPATAAEQAALVSPDGSTIGTSQINWIGSPHFYQKGSLIVLYLGDQAKVLNALKAVLGRPFSPVSTK